MNFFCVEPFAEVGHATCNAFLGMGDAVSRP
jgi:hypothetical protein